MWQLLQVFCLFWLAQAGRVLPRLKNDDRFRREIVPQRPVIPQKEILPQLPFIPQKEILPQLQIILQEESENRCQDTHSCDDDIIHLPTDLTDFPPGRPTENNIGIICNLGREKSSYGPHNLPQSGFGHLIRQGNAINKMEEGFGVCCLRTDRLDCAQGLWQDVLQWFCDEEFSIKTRPYFCCTESDSARYSCFEREARFPNYDLLGPPRPSEEPTTPIRRANNLDPYGELEKKMKEIFPPGEPNVDSIKNICRLRKFRSGYLKNTVPQSNYGRQQRQAKAINQLELWFKICCKKENAVSCAHDAWEKVLKEFCDDEISVKTRHYECCTKETSTAMYSCFSSKAPHPNYDWEIQTLNLGELQNPALQLLCGEMQLLSKKKQIPLLVKDITEACCQLSFDDRVGCAEQKKKDFIDTLCTTNQTSWKDSQTCCEQEDHVSCFNTNYLNKVSIAAANAATATSPDLDSN